MKRIFLFIAICIIFVGSVFSQHLSINRVETKMITNQGLEFIGNIVEENKDLYLFPSWRNKGILYLDGNEYTITNLNFNISKSTISSKLKNGNIFEFRSVDVMKFSINGQLFRKNGRSYYEVLVEEKSTYFYKRYDVRYKEGGTHRMGGEKLSSAKLMVSNAYLVKSGSESKTIELNKKSVLEYFSSSETELKQYVKENRLSYKNEEDLIQMFSYMLKQSTKSS